MNTSQVEAYLSDALDQEACKATLIAALTSRVEALHARGIPVLTLIVSLENLADERDQLNTDAIEDVLDWMLATLI